VNTSATSFTASASASYVVIGADVTPPVVRITSPTQGTVLSKKGSGKINIQASASDASGISRITLSVDSVVVKTCTAATSCSYSWVYSKAASGLHTITAVAVDNSANKNQSSKSITVTK
jgi:hypothetical protein